MISKQQNWHKLTKYFSSVTDGVGMRIDKGILETVVVLNVLGFNTRMSCQGHSLKRAYYIGPWVDIEIKMTNSIKKLEEKSSQFLKQAKQLETSDPKNRKKIDALYTKSHHYSILVRKRHLKVIRKLATFLSEFYQNRVVGFETRLILDVSLPGWTRLLSQGTVLQDGLKMDEKKKNLQKYQQEMRGFTEFLKKKYFKI